MVIQLDGPSCSGQYQSFRNFKSGGMGKVYTGFDIINKKKIAVKTIEVSDVKSEYLLEQEFMIATSLEHENILKTYYYNKFEESGNLYFYSIAEFCPLGNLDKKIKGFNGNIAIDTCLKFFNEILSGLLMAHKSSIIHRDLKPDNILVSESGTLKICDFGLSKYVGQQTRSHTHKGWGTDPYVSPECWQGLTNTFQMDIYSLGIIFFEILTKERPFKGPETKDYENQHRFSDLPELLDYRNDIPTALAEIIKKMTYKNTNRRYKDVENIIADLQKVIILNTIEISPEHDSFLKRIYLKDKSDLEQNLKSEKEKEQNEIVQKTVDYAINDLFEMFIKIVKTINLSLIDKEIIYRKFYASSTNPVANELLIRFNERKLRIHFYAMDLIPNYIKMTKQNQVDTQIRNYGRLISQPIKEYIEDQSAFILGSAETDVPIGDGQFFGFNILLKRTEVNDLYGEWQVCYFKRKQMFSNVITNDFFLIEPSEFFKKFDLAIKEQSSQFEVYYQKLTKKDIKKIIYVMV